MCIGTNGGAVDMRESFNGHAAINFCIANHAVSADAHAIAQRHFALKHAANINRHIASAPEYATNINTIRISQRNALVEQGIGDIALIDTLKLSELYLAVDAQRFPDLSWLR